MGNPSRNVQFTLDPDGYFSRECPSCERRFKIAPGKGSPNPLAYCPYCGHHGEDCWWTQDQLAYMNDQAGQLADDVIGPELDRMARDFNRQRRPGSMIDISIKVTRNRRGASVAPPEETTEPMTIVRFDCCGEDVKVLPDVAAPHCIICGKQTSPADQ